MKGFWGTCDEPGMCGFVPPGTPQCLRVAVEPCLPRLLAAMRIYWTRRTTGESGDHPLGLVTVPGVAPSRSIGRLEWRPHSSAMGGSRPVRSSTLCRENGCRGKAEHDGAMLCGGPRCGVAMRVFWRH